MGALAVRVSGAADVGRGWAAAAICSGATHKAAGGADAGVAAAGCSVGAAVAGGSVGVSVGVSVAGGGLGVNVAGMALGASGAGDALVAGAALGRAVGGALAAGAEPPQDVRISVSMRKSAIRRIGRSFLPKPGQRLGAPHVP